MPQRVYATPEQYPDFAEDEFAGGAEKLSKRLRAASIEVERLTQLARFDTDEDGYPTDADVSEAFAEATCAIVEYWEETDDPSGAESYAGAVKIGSVSLGTTSSSRDAETPRDRKIRRIGEKAVTILENAGLTTAPVSHW